MSRASPVSGRSRELTAAEITAEIERFNASQEAECSSIRAHFEPHGWTHFVTVTARGASGADWKAWPCESWPRSLEALRVALRAGVAELRLQGAR